MRRRKDGSVGRRNARGWDWGYLHFQHVVQQEFMSVPWTKWTLQRVAGVVLLLVPNHSRGLLAEQGDPGGKRPWVNC